MSEFQAFRVSQKDGATQATWQSMHNDSLPDGDVLIDVKYSSLNYKDALSYIGNKGVTRNFPHTPGIDAAGIVVQSNSSKWQAGQEVVCFGFDLGMNTAGGFAQRIRVPAGWVLNKPDNLSLADSMTWGTAGFTAGLSWLKLQPYLDATNPAPVLVTGATGGVGVMAVALLTHLGFNVVAVSGKADKAAWLQQLGAKSVISRQQCLEAGSRPLSKAQYQGVLDTVGGDMLGRVLPQVMFQGAVSTCGMIAGNDFQTSVFPFILRGINLLGVDSSNISQQAKQNLLDTLAENWQLNNLKDLVQEIGKHELANKLDDLLAGKSAGRYRLNLGQ